MLIIFSLFFFAPACFASHSMPFCMKKSTLVQNNNCNYTKRLRQHTHAAKKKLIDFICIIYYPALVMKACRIKATQV